MIENIDTIKTEGKKCNTNPVVKYIRIALSLGVIGLGIYYQNPVGLLGLMTLYTAVTGNCGTSIKIGRGKEVER